MKGNYGISEHGNFEVIDTYPIDHHYCIGSRHVEVAADKFNGILNEDAIEYAERQGYGCRTCRGNMRDHKLALNVACSIPFKTADGHVVPELHAYLLKIKDECDKNGYVGFVFSEARRDTTKTEQSGTGCNVPSGQSDQPGDE